MKLETPPKKQSLFQIYSIRILKSLLFFVVECIAISFLFNLSFGQIFKLPEISIPQTLLAVLAIRLIFRTWVIDFIQRDTSNLNLLVNYFLSFYVNGIKYTQSNLKDGEKDHNNGDK